MCSTRDSISRTSTQCCSFGRPRARRSSCSNSGRGLRRTHSKAVLTVLDFVGYHRKEFNFSRSSVRSPGSTASTGEGREGGLPLPAVGLSGAPRQAEPRCRAGEPQVADRQPLGSDRRRARVTRDDSLESFLERSGLELSDILRRGSHSWTKLRHDAGLETLPGSELEEKLLKRVRAFAHVDDPVRAPAYRTLLADDSPHYEDLSPAEQRIARMLYYSFWSDGGGFDVNRRRLSRDAPRERPRAQRSQALSTSASRPLATCRMHSQGHLADVPLQVHARYQREEILAALDFPRMPNSFREGVFYFAEHNVDAFFITLKKSEADYSPNDDVRRLPDLTRPVPLGVAVDDVGELPHGPRYSTAPPRFCSSCVRSRRTSSARRRICSSGQRRTSPTPAIVPSRSRGGLRRLCRRTSSTTPQRWLSSPARSGPETPCVPPGAVGLRRSRSDCFIDRARRGRSTGDHVRIRVYVVAVGSVADRDDCGVLLLAPPSIPGERHERDLARSWGLGRRQHPWRASAR